MKKRHQQDEILVHVFRVRGYFFDLFSAKAAKEEAKTPKKKPQTRSESAA